MSGRIRRIKKVKLGFIGLGRIFRIGYADWLKDWLRKHPDVELAGISDIDENLCKKYHRKYGVPYFTDPNELLSGGRVNAVVISSPNWAHEEQVVAAAENGAHALCEKPMAPASAACARMNDACERAGVFLQISFMRRFSPAMQAIRKMVSDGELGEIIELNCVWPLFLVDLDSPPFSGAVSFIEKNLGYPIGKEWGAWRLKDPRCGGGDFLDHGPHICDLFTWIAGEISHVSAESRTLVEGRNEDFTCCRLKFRSGAFGSVTTTLYDFAAGLEGRVDGFIRGAKGRIDFVMPDTNWFKPIRFTHYRYPKTGPGKIIRALGLLKGGEKKFPADNLFRDQLDYFVSTILGDRPPHRLFGREDFAACGRDGEYTIRIVEKAYESASRAPCWLAVE